MSKLLKLSLVLLLFNPFILHAGDDKDGTVISLSQQGSIEIEEDLLVADLKYSSQNIDAAKLQQDINQVIAKAFEVIEKYPNIEVSTKRYSVYKNYNSREDKKEARWHGEQSIVINGLDQEKVLELLDKLQQLGMTTNYLQYQLSHQTQEAAYNSLIEPTILKLKAKAQNIAKALGKKEFEFLSLNIDAGSNNVQPIHRYKMAELQQVEDAKPIAKSGKTLVTATIKAKILIKD